MMACIEKKETADSAVKPASFFRQTMFELGAYAPVILTEPSALDAVLELARDIEPYRGKGTQILADEFIRLFHRLILEANEEFSSGNTYSDETVANNFKKITTLAFGHVNGKRARTKRAASVREGYWEILTEMREQFIMPEVLDLAQHVALDDKASIPERRGALTYLLDSWDEEQPDEKTLSVIEIIRENAPSRDVLFMILDAGVESGDLGEMTALFELEDWDEKND